MQSKKIKIKNKLIAQLYLFLDVNFSIFPDKESALSSTLKNVKNSNIGYAGFKSKNNLHDYLISAIFDPKEKDIPKILKYNFDTEKITEIIKDTIKLCHKTIESSITNIFVFPTFDNFVKQKMNGAFGYTPYKNTILIFLNLQNRKWEKALASTIAHEFNHSLILNYNTWETLLDSLIFEGLAENFNEKIIGGKSPWIKALNLSQSKKIFLSLENKLDSKDYSLYRSVFLENKEYPLWTGYSIGYYIVRSFIKINPDLKWPKILKLNPKNILEKSNFIKKPSRHLQRNQMLTN